MVTSGLGLIFIVVGVRHSDFFGINWKAITSVILGVVFIIYSLIEDKEKKDENNK